MIADLEPIRHFFEQKIGLNADLISDDAWIRLINKRLAACKITDVATYYRYLFTSPIEFNEFVELLVVPETWFFRDKDSLEWVVDDAVNHLNWNEKKQSLRILSIPCSSGEEPYSIAMMFLKHHFPVDHLYIDAVDISKSSLEKAKAGIYNKNSFRTKDLNFRDLFFSKLDADYLLKDKVRHMVHFSQKNLFDSTFLETFSFYDIIFCRNLFIYLNSAAQERGMKIFKEILKPQGVLVVGTAESEIVRSYGFVTYGPLKVCAFTHQKMEEKTVVISPKVVSKDAKLIAEISEKIKVSDQITKTLEKSFSKDEKIDQSIVNEAKKLADLGRLSEALMICHQSLKHSHTNPQVYFLIGLIEHAMGHEKISEEYFLKTLYLDPDYYEALIYLALIAEKQGNFVQAELFRKRVSRLEKSMKMNEKG